jgi:hypothetical protein
MKKDHRESIRHFYRIRNAISFIFIGGLVGFPLINFLPPSYDWVVAVYMLAWLLPFVFLLCFKYRCPFCNAIPRGRPIPYVDLIPKACSSCGHSLRLEDEQE